MSSIHAHMGALRSGMLLKGHESVRLIMAISAILAIIAPQRR
jgi:hypothetical protein